MSVACELTKSMHGEENRKWGRIQQRRHIHLTHLERAPQATIGSPETFI